MRHRLFNVLCLVSLAGVVHTVVAYFAVFARLGFHPESGDFNAALAVVLLPVLMVAAALDAYVIRIDPTPAWRIVLLVVNGLICGAAWLVSARWVWRRVRRPRPAGLCPACGYDLRGSTGPTCPECGASIGGPVAGPE